ncbi:TPA: hypothetical protein ACGO7F_001804 [Streptococcus suis]
MTQDKLRAFWENIGRKNQILVIVLGVSVLLFLYFGYKDSGGIYYGGYWYEAGSLFNPSEWGDSYDVMVNSQGVEEVNAAVSSLRMRHLLPVLLFGGGLSYTAYSLYKTDDFMREFLNLF